MMAKDASYSCNTLTNLTSNIFENNICDIESPSVDQIFNYDFVNNSAELLELAQSLSSTLDGSANIDDVNSVESAIFLNIDTPQVIILNIFLLIKYSILNC